MASKTACPLCEHPVRFARPSAEILCCSCGLEHLEKEYDSKTSMSNIVPSTLLNLDTAIEDCVRATQLSMSGRVK